MTLPAGPITAFRASTIVGIQGPAGPQGPAGGGASVTWANDLSSSTNTNQYVSGISGILGTGGTITIGDGVHNTTLAGVASAQSLAPQLTLAASNGWAGNSGIGATLFVEGGFGGSAAAGSNTGGNGGDAVITGGYGGTSTGTAANSNGGRLRLLGGDPGTGGSGAAGLYGDVFLGSNAAFKAFATDNAAGPGFGIGTTPGFDPTITRGTGVPAATQTNGSLFLRTDGSSGANALYAREGGAWYAVGGTSTVSADLTYEGQFIQLAAAGSGNGTFVWPASAATATLTQNSPASDLTPGNFAINAAAAYAGASTHLTGGNITLTSGSGASSNGTPGNVVVNMPAPTGSGNEGHLQLQRAGSPFIDFGAPNTFGSAYAAIWFKQASPTISNYNFLGDGTNCYLQAASGGFVTLAIAANGGTFAVNGSQAQFFLGNLFASNGGSGIIATAQTSSLPTSVSTSSVQWWANTGSPGSLGLFATGVQFHNLAGAVKVSQDTPIADNATTGLTVKAQSAYASASTNVNGAATTLAGGNSTNGTLGAAILLGGATNSGSVAGTIGVPTSQTWAWTSTTISTTTGTVTLSSSQYNTPLIRINATLTGNLNVTFPNQAGYWIVDTNSLVLSGHTFTLQSGTATFSASFGKVYTVISYGGNTLVVSAG